MLRFATPDGPLEVALDALVVAGWTGRDAAAVAHHIDELAVIGVPRPSATPLFYRVSPALATQSERIEVLGDETSGEVEPLLVRSGGRLWLGIASDHTDRGLEAHSVAHAKQACPKVLGCELWPFDAVAERLDTVALGCTIEGGTPYQSGTCAQILPLSELIRRQPLEDGHAMLCGTLPAIGGVQAAAEYRMTLSDPALGREMSLGYRVVALPVIA